MHWLYPSDVITFLSCLILNLDNYINFFHWIHFENIRNTISLYRLKTKVFIADINDSLFDFAYHSVNIFYRNKHKNKVFFNSYQLTNHFLSLFLVKLVFILWKYISNEITISDNVVLVMSSMSSRRWSSIRTRFIWVHNSMRYMTNFSLLVSSFPPLSGVINDL